MSDYKSFKTEGLLEKSKNIDRMSSLEIAALINDEDKTVPFAVEKALGDISKGIDCLAAALKNEGRIIYAGAGTSGRLGVMDATECPPTYGVPAERVTAFLAGGRNAMFESIEDAEDDPESIKKQMALINFNKNDVCVGISASGSAECVKGALEYARSLGSETIAVTNNKNSPLFDYADITIAVEVGPEVIKGSTRMKAGTAQKLVLNMLSTGAMVKYGRTRGNLMAYMVPSNKKLVDRAVRMITEETLCSPQEALEALEKNNNVIAHAIDSLENHKSR